MPNDPYSACVHLYFPYNSWRSCLLVGYNINNIRLLCPPIKRGAKAVAQNMIFFNSVMTKKDLIKTYLRNNSTSKLAASLHVKRNTVLFLICRNKFVIRCFRYFPPTFQCNSHGNFSITRYQSTDENRYSVQSLAFHPYQKPHHSDRGTMPNPAGETVSNSFCLYLHES